VDIVCHCAASIPGQATAADFHADNAVGTAHLVNAAVAAGVRRVVYISTDSVYGDAGTAPAVEDQPPDPRYFDEGEYPRSKLEGERLAQAAAAAHGLELVVLRTCLIYGPGRSPGSDLLRHWAGRRLQLLWGAGRARISMVYVSDLAEAAVLAATQPQAAGRVYNVSGGPPHRWRDIAHAVGRATGRRRWLLALPGAAVLPLAGLVYPTLLRLAPRLASRCDPRSIRFLLADHVVDIARIQHELGYVPKVSLADGVRRTLAASGQGL
jgi:nucleoside-diphosphate-sugar epimerase